MSEEKLLAKFTRGGRRGTPHGYSYLMRKCSDEDRLRIVKYLIGCREALLTDLGGEDSLSAQKMILIDRLISLLGVIRGIESFFQESILTDEGELRPALGKNYLSYVNSARLILVNLGLEKADGKVLSPIEYIKQLDHEESIPEHEGADE